MYIYFFLARLFRAQLLQEGGKRPISQVRFVSPQAKLRWGGTEPGTGSGARLSPGTGTARGCLSPASRGAWARPGFRLPRKKKKIAFNKDAPCSGGEQSPRLKSAPPLSEIAFLIEIASNPGRLRSWFLLF